MGFYEEMAEMAAELLEPDPVGFGQAGSLRIETREDDPDSLTPGDATVTDYPCKIAIIDYTDRQRDNERILMTDRRALIAAEGLTVEPTSAYKLVDAAGGVYEIVIVKPINPAGLAVVYDAQVRR